jgi:hypothetical protein
LLEEVARIQKLSDNDARVEFAALCSKYKEYADFDIIQVRDYVLYSDGLDWADNQEIIRRHNDIVSFCQLQGKTDRAWNTQCNAPHEGELQHLERYVRRIEDTIFIFHLRRAERDYRCWQANCQGEIFSEYENTDYAINQVVGLLTLDLHIYIKATQEFGKVSVLHGDDQEVYRSYYRSDKLFKKEKVLDELNIPALFPHER